MIMVYGSENKEIKQLKRQKRAALRTLPNPRAA